MEIMRSDAPGGLQVTLDQAGMVLQGTGPPWCRSSLRVAPSHLSHHRTTITAGQLQQCQTPRETRSRWAPSHRDTSCRQLGEHFTSPGGDLPTTLQPPTLIWVCGEAFCCLLPQSSMKTRHKAQRDYPNEEQWLAPLSYCLSNPYFSLFSVLARHQRVWLRSWLGKESGSAHTAET